MGLLPRIDTTPSANDTGQLTMATTRCQPRRLLRVRVQLEVASGGCQNARDKCTKFVSTCHTIDKWADFFSISSIYW